MVSALTFVTSVANVFPRGRTCLSTRPRTRARNLISARAVGIASPTHLCLLSTSGHTGEKPYTCLECSPRFRQPTARVISQCIHTGEKPSPCPDCEQRFSSSSRLRSTLLQHQLLHTGEKSYPCPDCGRAFRRGGSLAIHRSTHTEEKLHSCEAVATALPTPHCWPVIGVYIQASGPMPVTCAPNALPSGATWLSTSFCIPGRSLSPAWSVAYASDRGGLWSSTSAATEGLVRGAVPFSMAKTMEGHLMEGFRSHTGQEQY
ncbi:Zinc finger protein 689 [Lemmus lemmus]